MRVRKYVVFVFSLCVLSTAWAVRGNAFGNDEKTVKRIYLEVCSREDSEQDSIAGVIRIKQKIDSTTLVAFIDTNLGVIATCENGRLEKKYTPNSIKINKDEFSIGDSIGGVELSSFIPNIITTVSTAENLYIIIEMYWFRYTGGSYHTSDWGCIFIKVDKNGKVVGHENRLLYRGPLSDESVVREINNIFGEK